MRIFSLCLLGLGLSSCVLEQLESVAAEQTSTGARESLYWQYYLASRQPGTDKRSADAPLSDQQVLPNFSYAGYRYGEESIPTLGDPLDYGDRVPELDPGTGYAVFPVTTYGAIADDGKSDKEAIQQTIFAAEAYVDGGGKGAIVYFPRGRFRVNELADISMAKKADGSYDWHRLSLTLSRSRVILRGSGSGPEGTELFMAAALPAKDPAKMWTTPSLLIVGYSPENPNPTLPEAFSSRVISESSAGVESSVVVEDASQFQKGQWILLSSRSSRQEELKKAVYPYPISPLWKNFLAGYLRREVHQIIDIDDSVLTFKAPVMSSIRQGTQWAVEHFVHIEDSGIEGFSFVGNWQEPFVHHKSALHDSGWSLISMSHVVNSWARDIRLKNFNIGISTDRSAASTLMNISFSGNPGHGAGGIKRSNHVLAMNLVDTSKAWHGFGFSHYSAGNAIVNSRHDPSTSPDIHSAQPRKNLFDGLVGGWVHGRWGGSVQNLPNHLSHLVFWNPVNTRSNPASPFEFMQSGSPHGKIPMPYLIGLEGYEFDVETQAHYLDHIDADHSSFLETQPGQLSDETGQPALQAYVESTGEAVRPFSLYAAQLKQRLGYLPDWYLSHAYQGQAQFVHFSRDESQATSGAEFSYQLFDDHDVDITFGSKRLNFRPGQHQVVVDLGRPHPVRHIQLFAQKAAESDQDFRVDVGFSLDGKHWCDKQPLYKQDNFVEPGCPSQKEPTREKPEENIFAKTVGEH